VRYNPPTILHVQAAVTQAESSRLAPTPAQERYEFLDVLRGFALAGIVLANMVSYFWHNDILEAYAVCGALLLLFRRASNRTIILASLLALTAPLVIHAAGWLPRGTFTGPRDALFSLFGFTREARVAIWTDGSLADILRLNAASWFSQVDYLLTSGMLFRIFGCFLLGFLIGRNGIHTKLKQHRPAIERIAVLGLVVGMPLNVVFARTYVSESLLQTVVATVGIIPLSAGYACALASMWMGRHGGLLVEVFGPVGRMALTNYVSQSVVCALIFRSVGLGLGGRMGPTLYLPVGLAVYLLQLAISRAWLSRFQFGPLEWTWRMLTYGRRVPLAKPAIAGASR
jgi:uncharacterized protein